MAIILTESAAKHIRTQLAKRGHGVGLRLGVKRVGCSGFAYTMAFADALGENDVAFESNGASVVIAREHLSYLEGTQVDFRREGLSEAFKFENPNVAATCGCGESFSIEKAAGTAV